MSEILTWQELGAAFPHPAIVAVDSATSAALSRESARLTPEGLAFDVLKALDTAGFTITTKKEN